MENGKKYSIPELTLLALDEQDIASASNGIEGELIPEPTQPQ